MGEKNRSCFLSLILNYHVGAENCLGDAPLAFDYALQPFFVHQPQQLVGCQLLFSFLKDSGVFL